MVTFPAAVTTTEMVFTPGLSVIGPNADPDVAVLPLTVSVDADSETLAVTVVVNVVVGTLLTV